MFFDILETKRSSMENFNRIIHCAAALVAKNDYSRFSHRTAWGKKEKSWDFSLDDFWWKKRHLHRVYIRIGRHFQFSWIASLSEDLERIYKRCWIYDIVCTYLEYQANYRFERGVKLAGSKKNMRYCRAVGTRGGKGGNPPLNVGRYVKVQLFWEGHKNLKKTPTYFDASE